MTTSPTDKQSLFIALAVAVGLVWSTFSGDLMAGFESPFPYSRSLAASLSDVVFMLLLVAAASGRPPSTLLGITGLFAPGWRPALWGAALFGPALLLCLLLLPPPAVVKPAEVLWSGIAGPIFEETVYRGLAVGVLMQLAGWRLLPACLMPAVFFGMVHAWQGADLAETAGAVAITGVGGLLFGWLFWRWNWNLWPPIILHVGLNLLWMVFALGETAVGGWQGNVMRMAVVAGAIGLTVWMVPKPAKTA